MQRGRPLLVLATFVLASGAIPGCGTQRPACPTSEAVPLVVTVTDAATGLNICDASVMAALGASTFNVSQEFHSSDAAVTDASCSYVFSLNSTLGTATYSVSATAPGYAPGQAANVKVDVDSCGLFTSTQYLMIKLVPTP